MKILFATSEAQPLIKTGGLADVSGSLPVAMKKLGEDVRLILPAYRAAVQQLDETRLVATLDIVNVAEPVRILESRIPNSTVTVYLVDSPTHFDRPGGPYSGPDGHDWPDNAARFTVFARAVTALALGEGGMGWTPDVVHCNDWQTGLVPALLSMEPKRPATLFTIHNMAYQGMFPWDTFQSLKLPYELWSMHTMEFHGQFSFIKGGLAFADRLTTVSPTYADEICTPELGYGLEGLLQYRRTDLHGVLNGVDYTLWNPSTDKLIAWNYDASRLDDKVLNKTPMLEKFGLEEQPDIPVIGMVGRLVEQKGIDLVINALDRLMDQPLQLIILGTGQKQYEDALRGAAQHYDQLGVYIGYDEALAHLVEAGADMFLMPSRFEPCGLNQMFSLRYGTAPIVRRTGGLADTVVDADAKHMREGTANGFVFERANPEALFDAVQRGLTLYQNKQAWHALARTGMQQDFSWERSAAHYRDLYRDAVESLGVIVTG